MADKIRIGSKYDLRGEYQPSDSEEDYSPKDRKLLEKVRKKKKQDSESEEEVYGFSGSDDDSGKEDFNMADSDVEGQEKSDDELPDSKAWGKRKKSYYSTDYVDQDYGGFGEDEEEAALMEEQEAKNIQRRLLEQLADDDFSLEFFTKKSEETTTEKETVIRSDLGQLSKRQKQQLLEKESPELAGLIDDFKTKLTVAKDDLQPVLNLVKDGKIPECQAASFVKTNYKLILNYCTNISFYLLLKTKKINIQNHPVVKRLYQYRQMLSKMEPVYMNVIKPQIDSIKTAIENNVELVIVNEPSTSRKRKSDKAEEASFKKLKLINSIKQQDGNDTGVSDDDDEFDGHDFLKEAKKANSESEESGFSDDDDDDITQPENKESDHDKVEDPKPSTSSQIEPLDEVGDKREITYQIAKNKGLTPHRKKEQRNPRVKHKMKFRKAKIRRKGAIREVRTEVSRYGGEVSGIKANVKKSVKIK